MNLPSSLETLSHVQLFVPEGSLEADFDFWHAKTKSAEAGATMVLARVGASINLAMVILARQLQSTDRSKRHREPRTVLTPPQAARQLGVDPATVINWIRSGQLVAANIGRGGQRPRYRIKQSDLDAFLKSRRPERKRKRKRRTAEPAGEIEFFN